MIDRICLWVFPVVDFASWCELVGTPQVASHAEYLTLLSAVQADQERQGRAVVRVEFTVAEMRAELEARGWANTPELRAAVTALRG